MPHTSLVPFVETERLILRGHELADVEDCAAMWADPAVVAHISGVPSSRDQSWARMIRYAGFWHHLGFGYWAVTHKESGAFLGEVGFSDLQRDTQPSLNGIPEAGWVLRTEAQGKGYATEAARTMLSWADAHLDAPATCAMFDPRLNASIHLARKLGFGDDVLETFGATEALFLHRPRQVAP